MTNWTYGFCDCFNNLSLCIITLLAPCYTMGKTAEKVGDNCCWCGMAYLCCFCIPAGIVRSKIREQKGIDGMLLTDFMAHLFCPLCALVQDAQEVCALGSGAGLSMARE